MFFNKPDKKKSSKQEQRDTRKEEIRRRIKEEGNWFKVKDELFKKDKKK